MIHQNVQVNNNYLFITFFSWYRMAILSRARGSPQPVPSLTTASTSCVPRQRSINSQAKFIHCSSSARYSLWNALYLIQYCNRAHAHWVNGLHMSFLKLKNLFFQLQRLKYMIHMYTSILYSLQRSVIT